jgi:hypothetical protein
VCSYVPLSAADAAEAADIASQGLGPAAGSAPGAYYRKICVDANGMSSGQIVWLANPPAVVDPVALAQQALGYNRLPVPGVEMSPSTGTDQLVNLVSWLWIDAASFRPVSATATAGGVTVTTTATPTGVAWDMGNGDAVPCAGPGTPYDTSLPPAAQSPSCSYTYRHSSAGAPGGAFTVTATVSFHVTWAATGVAPGRPAAGDLGTISRSSSVAVRVAEAEAVNTDGR